MHHASYVHYIVLVLVLFWVFGTKIVIITFQIYFQYIVYVFSVHDSRSV